jgi:predicted HicB family RNase H-like nuclease
MSNTKTAISRLKTVWGKVGLDEIPAAEETRGNLSQPEPPRKKSERTAQLNLRIKPDEKERIGLMALRERVNINEVFSRMLALYEREHGKVELTASKQETRK